MLSVFSALILGIVEGFTEFLPVSSTAHMILVSHLLGLDQTGFLKSFEIVIQGGAILAVVIFFWKKFFDVELMKRIIVAFIPTGIIGLLLYTIVKKYLLGSVAVVLFSLGIGGIILIVFERFIKKPSVSTDLRTLSYKNAVIIGIVQALAIIPGVSRSGATIVGGMALGLSKESIVEFSFLLAVPTILAATGLDLVKNIGLFSLNQAGILTIGFIVSFFAALVSIRFLLAFVKKYSFVSFGIYRIALVIIFALFFI